MQRPDHGRQIAAARALLRMSQADAAKAAGLHAQALVYNERRGCLPRFSYAGDKIANALEPLGVRFETRPDGYAVVFTAPGE